MRFLAESNGPITNCTPWARGMASPKQDASSTLLARRVGLFVIMEGVWVRGMDAGELERVRAELGAFASEVFAPFARVEQRAMGMTYVRGLMLDGQRKSMQPMAERLGTDHQRLQQFLTSSTWDHVAVRRRLAARAVQVVVPGVWIVGDTGFPKDGKASPAVAGSTPAPWARSRTVRSRCRCTPRPRRPRRCWTGGCSCPPPGTRPRSPTRTGRSRTRAPPATKPDHHLACQCG